MRAFIGAIVCTPSPYRHTMFAVVTPPCQTFWMLRHHAALRTTNTQLARGLQREERHVAAQV